MIGSDLHSKTIGICAIAAILVGCAQQGAPVVGAPGTIPRSSASSYTVLYKFAHRAFPHAGVIDVKGTLYGTTTAGGAPDKGYVYSVSSSGTEKVLHVFKGRSDGADPEAGLIDVNGTLYGTTFDGGGTGCTGGTGCGTVYSISTSGVEKVVYSFAGGYDGAHPMSGLINVNGTLYGTTYQGGNQGGTGQCSFHGHAGQGCGTAYSISTSGAEKVLYRFSGGSDGAFPEAGLIDVHGSLYGTTYIGGADAEGTVFRLTASGVKKTLHSFGAGSDGANPQASLIDVNGALYGTTAFGGGTNCFNQGCGTVYIISTTGAESVLSNFAGSSDSTHPQAPLVDAKGTLYGTTAGAGAIYGTIYSISTSGTESTVYRFNGGSDGGHPEAGLINMRGALYGTTAAGGLGHVGRGFGTVFALTP